MVNTREFDERNFAKSRAVCEKMAEECRKESCRYALHDDAADESWDDLEADLMKSPYDYCDERMILSEELVYMPTCPTQELFARDVVARAKSIAEYMVGKARCKERVYETWCSEKAELYKLLDECGSVENIRKRLMPEGMEWPRFDDGETVKVGDEFERVGEVKRVVAIHFTASSCYLQEDGPGQYYVGHGCFAKRQKHEHHDSWELIKRDALNFVDDNAVIQHDQDQMERDILDIVRRAKALAGKERKD